MKSYLGLDLLHASSRPDGSGGGWPIRDPERSPSGFWGITASPSLRTPREACVWDLVRSVREVHWVCLGGGSLGPLVQPPGGPGTSLATKGAA